MGDDISIPVKRLVSVLKFISIVVDVITRSVDGKCAVVVASAASCGDTANISIRPWAWRPITGSEVGGDGLVVTHRNIGRVVCGY